MQDNDHTCFFHCINTCRVPQEMFGYSDLWPLVQTAFLGPDAKTCVIPFILYLAVKSMHIQNK